jgi:hypothetical protein
MRSELAVSDGRIRNALPDSAGGRTTHGSVG